MTSEVPPQRRSHVARHDLPSGRKVNGPDWRPQKGERPTWKYPEDREIDARVRGHLRHWMARKKTNPLGLAKLLGIDDGNVYRLMSGKRGFSAGMVLRIARVLGFPLIALMTEDPPEGYSDAAVGLDLPD